MNEIVLHPNVYSTGKDTGLVSILERVWINEHTPGEGTIYIVSGFGNYNGGVRFFDIFRKHIEKGGKLIAIFAGSNNSRLTSKQLVRELLSCGAQVHIINRKRLLHAKCYGYQGVSDNSSIVISSGNFTGPGMSLNVEMSISLDEKHASAINFKWNDLVSALLSQKWDIYQPNQDESNVAWNLLYDEESTDIILDDNEKVTMILRLSHSDTARIQASPGSTAYKGTQYFWLSKDCYSFFPPLVIHNRRGTKATYSCIINLSYIDLGVTDSNTRVTFEAENNLDFRLGTGRLRGTCLVEEGDYAAISRISEDIYELRLFKKDTSIGKILAQHAINFIGHREKKYGYISNNDFQRIISEAI